VSALTIIELLGASLSNEEVWATIDHVGVLLEKTHESSTLRRLATAFRSLFLTRAVPAPPDWDGFSLKNAVRKYESHLIKLALKDTAGKVTAAARLLGFRHHQSLITLISARHKELIETGARTAVRPRRSHLIVHPKRAKKKKVLAPQPQATSQISILHVEGNEQIAKQVKDVFASEEWRVELCVDGYSALDKLTGNDHYDLILVDNDIPELSGLELVKRARTISHRRRTPIVMLSGSDCETDAWRAGVDAFLKKPEQISRLSSTIARLLRVERQEKPKLQ
jgi:two-component system chemotaxis response regulator CheY